MSTTEALRNKLNYSIFLRSVYVFVEDLFLGRNEVPFGEVFSISGFKIDSFEIYSLVEGEYIPTYTFQVYSVVSTNSFLFLGAFL